MNQELRERTILPLLIPVAAIVVTEIVVFSMAQVLLAAGTTGAVIIALVAAVGIMVVCTAVAGARRMRTSSIVGLLVLGGLVTVAAGAYGLQQGPAIVREAHASRPTVETSAADLEFSFDALELSAGGTIVEFDNADSQPHNIAVYPDESSLTDPLFKGEIIQAGQKITYDVPAIDPGEYFFQCDVHPTMKGPAVVAEGEHGEHGEDAGSEGDEH